ncbi:helix-turn-helix transcriptional regulator, partial [Streptomyces sp. YC504]
FVLDGALGTYLRGMGAVLSGDARGFEAGRGTLRQVVDAAGEADEAELLLCAGAAALVVGDLAAACRLGSRALAAARARGQVTVVPRALEQLAYAELRAGRHARARAHAEEGSRAARSAGRRNDLAHHQAILALVASLDQDARTVAEHAAAAEGTAARHGLVQTSTLAQWALGRADLARGRPQEAAARLHPLISPGRGRGHFAIRMLVVPCFVEASVLAGRAEGARAAVEEFAVWAGFGHDPQAPAQLLRCRALLAAEAHPAETADLYTEALARHETADGDFERARTALLHGKWLRRARQPAKARDTLRDALIAFERCGAGAWAAQAAAELRATGEASASQLPDRLDGLTPQQLRIARLVAEGATNREVARHLSVSPRTVDHHLRNVFATLGVRSRVELSRAVARADGATADA